MARRTPKKSKTSVKAAADRAEARADGRPTKYDPKFCETVLSLGELGKSRTQIATFLRISRQTLLNWEDTHPEFLDAMSLASQFAQAWWEDQGQIGLNDKSFNGHVFSFQMKNRFRTDYTEKVEVKHDASQAFAMLWQRVGGGEASSP